MRKSTLGVSKAVGAPRLSRPGVQASLDVIVPARNEQAVLQSHVHELIAYLSSLDRYRNWRLIIVNDGSDDDTGELAEDLARRHREVRVVHHDRARGLGAAIRTGFAQGHGDLVVTMDADLSYSPPHVRRLLRTADRCDAKLVLASAYGPGGRVSEVPFLRALLSRQANRYLSFMCRGRIATATCMVRAYRRSLIDSFQLASNGPEINFEILENAFNNLATIVEVPAHLHWRSAQRRPLPGSFRDLSVRIAGVIRWGFRLREALMTKPVAVVAAAGDVERTESA